MREVRKSIGGYDILLGGRKSFVTILTSQSAQELIDLGNSVSDKIVQFRGKKISRALAFRVTNDKIKHKRAEKFKLVEIQTGGSPTTHMSH